MRSPIVISGAGIAGLLGALVMCERGEGERVIVVDRNVEPGGLLRRFRYGVWGDFDYGMHNILETGIAELDRLIFGLLDETEWQLLEGAKRDVAGLFVNGRLQTNTPYFDLRTLPSAEFESCRRALLQHLHSQAVAAADGTTGRSAREFLVARFGEQVADRTLVPAVEKVYRRRASELDVMATMLTPMTRIAFCDEPAVRDMSATPFFRERVAWSDQRTLPLERSSGRRALYPASYGIHRVVDAIVSRILSANGRIVLGAEIASVATQRSCVRAVTIKAGERVETIGDVSQLVWAANIPALSRLLGEPQGRPAEPPLRTVVANLVVDRVPEGMGDLYYFFCYDPAFRTFRVTNFVNYCRGAARNGGYPVCLEMLMTDEETRGVDLARLAAEEFRRFGISSPGTKVLFVAAEKLDSGFPLPSTANVDGMAAHRDAIRARGLSNVALVGMLAEDRLFFQTDVMADAYRKLQ